MTPPRLTNDAVAQNVSRLRRTEGISARVLSERLKARGLRMSVSGVADIEAGRRVVSVDQLTALADALSVSPVALLMPYSIMGDRETVALSGVEPTTSESLLKWLENRAPLDDGKILDFRRRSTPPWSWAV